MTGPDLSAAASVVELADTVVQQAARHLAPFAEGDEKQVVLYDVAHAAAAVEIARSLLDYGAKGEVEGRIACAFVADAVHDVASRLFGREQEWGVEPGALDPARSFLATFRDRLTSSERKLH